jgi:hypothetical protein
LARLNAGYGTEFHLLRMLGRHRRFFDSHVCGATGADSVEWLDFPSGEMRRDKNGRPIWDREWVRLDFLPVDDSARIAWQSAWPMSHRGFHNWDAIGRLMYGESCDWLLVEAKANIEELSSSCKAENQDSIDRIKKTLDQTKSELNVADSCDWLTGYYQFCNRLAVLHIMNDAGTAAHMLNIYFYGDVGDSRRTCPADKHDWRPALVARNTHLGLGAEHQLQGRLHELFIDVRCNNLRDRFGDRLEFLLNRRSKSKWNDLMSEVEARLEGCGVELFQPSHANPSKFSWDICQNSSGLSYLIYRMMSPPETAESLEQLLSMVEVAVPSDGHLD